MAVASKTHDRKHEQRKLWEKEWPFTVELVALSSLFADERYQRPVLEPFVEKQAAKFDPRLVGALDASRRGDGLSFAILDGRQRHEIVSRAGKKAVYCAVYQDMTIADEAEFFLFKNRERRNMHPYYALRARRVAGEPGVDDIFLTVENAGFKLSASSVGDEAVAAIVAVEQVYNMTSIQRPDGALAPTLHTIKAAFLGRDGGTSGEVIRGLGRFFQSFHDEEIDREHLVRVLTETGPKLLIGRGRDRAVGSRHSAAYHIAQEAVTIYNKGMARGHKLPAQAIHGKNR